MRTWVAAVPDRPDAAWAAARTDRADGGPAAWLAAWQSVSRPVPAAMQADERAFDPDGDPATAFLLLLEHRVLFDDPAVQRGRQLLLAHGGFDVVTTFSRDASTFGGALLAWRGRNDPDDPFAWVGPMRRCHIGPGLLAAGPPLLPSAIVERYAGQAWPADRFGPVRVREG